MILSLLFFSLYAIRSEYTIHSRRVIPIPSVSIYMQTVFRAFFEGFYIAVYIQAIGRPFFENLFSSFSGVRFNVTLCQHFPVSLPVRKSTRLNSSHVSTSYA